jgi:DNA processing protein
MADPSDRDYLYDCLWLSEFCRLSSIDGRSARKLLQVWPSVAALRAARPAEVGEALAAVQGRGNRIGVLLADRRWQQDQALRAREMAGQGIRAILSTDPDFPARLKEIGSCPLMLYYRGDCYQELARRSFFVTVIGTRTPTEYGTLVARQIAGELAENGVAVISGLARGIDAAAHRAAMAKCGLTIAVVGNGPDQSYPRENTELMQQIANQGLIFSEYPPGTPPRQQHFPARNRILSGLADAVAVIEAARKSGTLITAGFAADQGRDVFAVPGNILSPASQGCNQLIADGAYVLQSAQDLLWRLPAGCLQASMEQWVRHCTDAGLTSERRSEGHPDGYVDPAGRSHAATDASQAVGDQAVISPERQVIRLLAAVPLDLSDLSGQLALSIEETAVLLSGLELAGFITCRRGRYTLTETALCSI